MAFDPDWVVKPGSILSEEMTERGISKRMVARVCGIDVAIVEGILDGTVEITDRIAIGLSRLGCSPQLWLNLERIYRDGLARGKIDIDD